MRGFDGGAIMTDELHKGWADTESKPSYEYLQARIKVLICADCSESLDSAILGRIDRERYHTDLIELKAAFGAFDEQRSAK